MKRIWPIVAVRDVAESATWYARLLNAANNHPGATVFDQIVDDRDGAVLLCLHHWDPPAFVATTTIHPYLTLNRVLREKASSCGS
jgi:hypothetical protein